MVLRIGAKLLAIGVGGRTGGEPGVGEAALGPGAERLDVRSVFVRGASRCCCSPPDCSRASGRRAGPRVWIRLRRYATDTPLTGRSGNPMEVCGVKKGIRSSKGHMMRVCVCFVATAFVCGSALGQSAEKPQFEVADVHTSPRTSQPFARGPFYTSGRYELRFATMLDMIRDGVCGRSRRGCRAGRTGSEMDRFDVFAKTPEKSTAESRRLMLQSLLAERFKLADPQRHPAHAGIWADREEAATEGRRKGRARPDANSPSRTPRPAPPRAAARSNCRCCLRVQEHHDGGLRGCASECPGARGNT